MGQIFVVIEHRNGVIRDISYEMLWKASELCNQLSYDLIAVLIGGGNAALADGLTQRADRVICVEGGKLKDFNSELYKEILYRLIEEYQPFLTLMAHSSWGMDYAPALSVKTGFPIATDCVDIMVDNGRPLAVRQIYSGKVFSQVSFKESRGYLFTVRATVFPGDKAGKYQGEFITKSCPEDLPDTRKQFVEFLEAGEGDVDISQSEVLISVGRGIGNQENIDTVKELAQLLGGEIACSRPVIDKNWLPKYRQVGTSGKTVKPKVYLALGISGSFQHMAGIIGGTVIAVNKYIKAPIFRVADYGVVNDLQNVVIALKSRLLN